jgi:hypothetical protein
MAAGRDLALTASGDLDPTNGGRMVEGQEAIAQRLKIRLRTFAGEYFLDTDLGLPWLEWSEGHMTPAILRQIRLAVLGIVRSEQGVTSVDQAQVVVSYDKTTKTVTISVGGVATDTGLLDLSVSVGVPS